ncbi:MAG: Lrp/AsnC family transcriptional regulator, partial [Flavobacteriaceae bacterium]
MFRSLSGRRDTARRTRKAFIMDDADRRILRAIQQQPDLTMRELGEVTGLSHTPCWRRLQRMVRVSFGPQGIPYSIPDSLRGAYN